MNILVLPPFTEAQCRVLEAGAPGSVFTYTSPAEATDEQVSSADVIVGNLPPERLAIARRVRLLQLNSAGYDALRPRRAPCRRAACSRAPSARTARQSRSTYTPWCSCS